MSDNLSVTVFSEMFNEIEQTESALSSDEQDVALLTAEADLRATHNTEIQTLRKRGEILYNAKLAAPGRYLAWQDEMRNLFIATEGERGFTYSEKTCENYVNLHLLYFHHSAIYEQYRKLPAWIVYQVASAVLNGRDPEDVPAIRQLSEKSAIVMLESGTPTGCGIPDSFPALIEMCEDGSISQLTAGRIVDYCENISELVMTTVARYGVRDTAVVGVLCDIEASTARAKAADEPYNNIFVEIVATNGHVSDEHGESVPLRDMSPRELWHTYTRSRHQGTDGGDGGGTKTKPILKDTISHAEAVAIAQELDDQTALDILDSDSDSETYQVKLDKKL